MDFYSRMVAFLKVLLPLAALAILATLFLLSRSIDLDATIPFSENEVADRLRDQQVTGPFFSGTTPKGDQVLIQATRARPALAGSPAEATDISARLITATGARMTLMADLATVDTAADMATFSGQVLITTSTGIEMRTETLNTALHGIKGNAPEHVSATSPIGDITAGQMEFAAQNGDGPLHVLFKSGVKLLYQPKKTE